MNFTDFIENKKVIYSEIDKQKAKALVKTSNNNILFIKNTKIDNVNSALILTTSYKALRQILEAICLLNGYKVYSHEAYVYYLLDLKEESISAKFDRLRKLRNDTDYHGKEISIEIAKDSKIQCINIINKLKEKYLKNLI